MKKYKKKIYSTADMTIEIYVVTTLNQLYFFKIFESCRELRNTYSYFIHAI